MIDDRAVDSTIDDRATLVGDRAVDPTIDDRATLVEALLPSEAEAIGLAIGDRAVDTTIEPC